tara:strand:+ start:3180 stop:3917 length:738 start_codon:yes stop_codon:yes gene_type:complete
MNISRSRLRRIISEEYLSEEGIQLEALDQDKFEEFMAWLNKKGPKPKWLGDDYGKSGKSPPAAPQVPGSDIGALETQPFPPPDNIPSDDAPESEYSGFQDRSGPSDMTDDDIVASINRVIQGKDPDHVAELFQIVFANLPDVEMSDAEEDPETLYSPGAEGRPTAGFRLEELKLLIRKVLEEGHYHDMGGGDEMYDALDPHGFEKMSDAELIDMMHKEGMEEMIVLDGEGDLANREEVIATLKDV